MISLFSNIGGKILGAVVVLSVLVAACFYVWHLHDALSAARTATAAAQHQADQYRQLAADNAVAAAAAKDDASKVQSALDAERQAADAREDEMSALRSEIDRSPDSEDAAVAPVLDKALDGLGRRR
ncbi:hypothetical protein SAMN05216548_108181 [Faunimonas pinastri]|uniref:Uncharacterized protein n=1 Tax=Faunimonas pinastri TaxID=1855383 RepID=A0A1H9JME6_9HYPH|nr:hypothetical protein [Faunimonas pinastri]SEQ87933.1 hypothetical protein SAMN05216548_108181 [Faunimonas pinastri]